MSKKWTTETAKAYVMKVLKGKQQPGLTYCSAIDYLQNYANIKVSSWLLKESWMCVFSKEGMRNEITFYEGKRKLA